MKEISTLTAFFDKQGIPCLIHEPLDKHTSFKIGGPAACFCMPEDTDQLRATLVEARRLRLPYIILGAGSNMLFSDEGYEGLVVCLENLNSNCTIKGNLVTAGAGVPLAEICVKAKQKGLSGIEFAYGIPGSLGGAIYMNAGAYGGEMAQVIQQVECLDEDLNPVFLSGDQLEFGYRASFFHNHPWVVLGALLQLRPGKPGEIEAAMAEHMKSRREKQPLDYPSAGSFFKRPPGAFAGALIEQCGLRGFRIGDAAISDKHCGFVVNLGKASSKDILRLASHVTNVVLEQTGYHLEKEIQIIEA